MARVKAKRAAVSEPVEGPWVLPVGWQWQRLGDCVEVHDYLRRPLNQTERNCRLDANPSAELYPYYGATGQVGQIDGYVADGEYVLLGEDGAPFLDLDKNKAYLVSGRFWVNNHAHVLKAGSSFGNCWLLHWLNTADYRGVVNGTTRLKLTQGAMNEMPVPVPPLGHEEIIIARIDELFTELEDGEAALERARGDLATWRKSLLKAAVTGELTADWRAANPPTETGADLLVRILTERRTRWLADPRNKGKRYVDPAGAQDAKASELLETWAWASFEQLFDVLSDLGLKLKERDYQADGHFPVIDQGASDIAGYTDDPLLARHPETPWLLFGDHTRRFKYVDYPFCVGADGVKLMRPASAVNPKFLFFALQAAHFEDRGYSRHFQFVRALSLDLPPVNEQDEIVARIQSGLGSLRQLFASIKEGDDASATLRQSILAAAFRGDLVA